MADGRSLTQSNLVEVDEQLFRHKDISLNCSDLDLLNGPYCINSRIIDFYFSLLSEQSQCTRAGRVLLVPTSVSSFIARLPSFDDVLQETATSFKEKELSIFVVDDWDDASDNQTWRRSLLIYVQNQNLFVHHDSYEEANKLHALKLYDILKPSLGHPKLVQCRTPQQKHYEDSGLIMMAIAREICAWCDSGPDMEDELLWSSELEKMNGAVADDMRKELLALINDLMVEDGNYQ